MHWINIFKLAAPILWCRSLTHHYFCATAKLILTPKKIIKRLNLDLKLSKLIPMNQMRLFRVFRMLSNFFSPYADDKSDWHSVSIHIPYMVTRQFAGCEKTFLPQFWVSEKLVNTKCSSHQVEHFYKRNKFSGQIWPSFLGFCLVAHK